MVRYNQNRAVVKSFFILSAHAEIFIALNFNTLKKVFLSIIISFRRSYVNYTSVSSAMDSYIYVYWHSWRCLYYSQQKKEKIIFSKYGAFRFLTFSFFIFVNNYGDLCFFKLRLRVNVLTSRRFLFKSHNSNQRTPLL